MLQLPSIKSTGPSRGKRTFPGYLVATISSLMLFHVTTYSQTDVPVKAFGIESWNGLLSVESDFRAMRITPQNYLADTSQIAAVRARIGLGMRSYFVHPKFIANSLDVDYTPGLARHQYIVSPDRSENRTAEHVRIQSTFMRSMPLSVHGFWDYFHGYVDREVVTSEEYLSRTAGGGASFRNAIAPLSLHYQNENRVQQEIATGRELKTMRDHVQFDAHTAPAALQTHRLNVSYEDLERWYFSPESVHNKTFSLRLSNTYVFDSSASKRITSHVAYGQQSGTTPYTRLTVDETGSIALPWRFIGGLEYRYLHLEYPEVQSGQHQAAATLRHKLFESLTSNARYQYSNMQQTVLREQYHEVLISFAYTKEIVADGRLTLDYTKRYRAQEFNNQSTMVLVRNETHTLTDGQITTLANPYIVRNAILITDPTESLIYEENLDYTLIPRGDFIEISRIPGGRIPNGATVYVDYSATMLASYTYGLDVDRIAGSIQMFNGLLKVHGVHDKLSYNDISASNQNIFRWYSQDIYGVSSRFWIFDAGVDFESYQTNVIPYNSDHYYLRVSGNIAGSLKLAMSCSYRDMNLTDNDERQRFADINGRMYFSLSGTTQVRLEGTWRFQEGSGIDLNLALGRFVVQTSYRNIIITGGVEGYRRDYLGDLTEYIRGYARLERRF